MRYCLPLLLLSVVALFTSTLANAAHYDKGRIEVGTPGTSVSNTTTTVPFTVNRHGSYAVQCDNDACVATVMDGGTPISCAGYYDPGDGGSMWARGKSVVGVHVPAGNVFNVTNAGNAIAVAREDGGTTCVVHAVVP